jgi:restriction endonuclease S subunit
VPSCFHSEANRQPPVITVSASGAYAGFISYFELPIFATDCTTIISLDEQKAKTRFVFEILKGRQEAIYNIQKGMAQPHVYAKDLIAMEIPLPPLDEQGRIVAELEGYRKVIEGARQVIANYKPTIKIDPKWPMVKLGSVCSQQRNIASLKAELDQPYIGLENVESGTGRLLSEASDLLEATSTSFVFDQSNVLYGKLRPYLNKVVLPNFRGRCTTELVPLLPSDQIERSFLFWLLLRSETVEVAMNGKTGARMPRTDMSVLLSMKIPLPPLDVQRQIVAELEAERKLVEANRELIGRMEAKIKAKLNEVWGEAAEKN